MKVVQRTDALPAAAFRALCSSPTSFGSIAIGQPSEGLDQRFVRAQSASVRYTVRALHAQRIEGRPLRGARWRVASFAAPPSARSHAGRSVGQPETKSAAAGKTGVACGNQLKPPRCTKPLIT